MAWLNTLGFALAQAFDDGSSFVGSKGVLIDQGLQGRVVGLPRDWLKMSFNRAFFQLFFVPGCERRLDVYTCRVRLFEQPAICGVDGPDSSKLKICLGNDRSS